MSKKHGKSRKKPNHIEGINKAFSNEEFAAEVFAPIAPVTPINQDEKERDALQDNPSTSRNTTLGWTAIGIAVASLFIWPIVLGPLAAIIGYFAYTRGNRSLGVWSIVLGLISLITYLALAPYYV